MTRPDWQHIGLWSLALAAAAVTAWRPELGKYSGPLLALLVGAGTMKWSPLYGPPTEKTDASPPAPPAA